MRKNVMERKYHTRALVARQWTEAEGVALRALLSV